MLPSKQCPSCPLSLDCLQLVKEDVLYRVHCTFCKAITVRYARFDPNGCLPSSPYGAAIAYFWNGSEVPPGYGCTLMTHKTKIICKLCRSRLKMYGTT